MRTFNVATVDAILNHPSVRPYVVPGERRLTSAEELADPRNYAFIDGAGLIFFQEQPTGHFTGHAYFVEGHRGRAALALGNAAIGALFTRYDALACYAQVPLALRPARWFARRLGFESLGTDPKQQFELFVMERGKWADS